MSISLRSNEKIIMKTDFHWSTYLLSGTWAFFCIVGSLGMLTDPNSRHSAPTALVIGVLPILYRFLSNYCKDYVVTNERLYLEDGILAKTKRDIPLNKINDLELNQGLIQRMVGSGNILVLTGNDKPNTLKCISNPEKFKSEVSQLLKVGKAV